MAATDPSARTSADDTELSQSGVGMAHLTVIPENFEPTDEDGDE